MHHRKVNAARNSLEEQQAHPLRLKAASCALRCWFSELATLQGETELAEAVENARVLVSGFTDQSLGSGLDV